MNALLQFVGDLTRWAMSVRAWNDPVTVNAIKSFTVDWEPDCGIPSCPGGCDGLLVLRVGWT